jgi:transcription elongation factor SPT5
MKSSSKVCTHELCLGYADSPTDGFIEQHVEGEDDLHTRRAHNALLDRDETMNERDLAQLAQDLTKRYSRPNVRYTGDMNSIPQRLLMPSVHDASLWQVRVKVRVLC